MNSNLRPLLLLALCLTPVTAEPQGIDQSLEFLFNQNGIPFIRWDGKPGRTYFIQVANQDAPLQKWTFAQFIEAGTGEPISYEVSASAERGFFRLKYTDKAPDPGETIDTADYDDDDLENLAEIEAYNQTDPLEPDSDGDGLPDGWEVKFGLDPNDATGANGAEGDPDGDGLTNFDEYNNGSHPCDGDSDGDGWSDSYENTVRTSATNPDTDGDGIPDNLDGTPLDANQADFSAASLLVISPQQ